MIQSQCSFFNNEQLTNKSPYYKLASFPVFLTNNFQWVCYTLIGVLLPVLLDFCVEKLKKVSLQKIRIPYVK